MPKNTYFIKENYKKVEEVREIKNEIPSYEEFLGNYEKENSINYDDLTHEDIISNKGYGPCSWNNPNCECYLGEGFMPLYMGCSAGGWNCRGTTPTTWSHLYRYLATADRGRRVCGNLIISREGRIKCAACQVEADWKEWQFACSNHPGSYNSFSHDELIHGLTMSMNLQRNSSYIKKKLMERLIIRLIEDR